MLVNSEMALTRGHEDADGDARLQAVGRSSSPAPSRRRSSTRGAKPSGAGDDAADRGRYARLHIREKTSRVAAVGRAAAPGLAKFARAASGEDVLRVRRRRRTGAKPSAVAAGQEGAGAGAALPVQLPPSALSEREANAFGEVAAALRAARHPFVSPALHADVAAADDQQRAVTYRRFAPLGSLKDAIHGCSDPRASYGVKYGFLERAAAAPTAAAAGAATGAAASATADGGPRHRLALPAAKVALYGRMVLEALSFCRAAGLPCVHLHWATCCSKTQAAAAAAAAVLEAQPLAAASAARCAWWRRSSSRCCGCPRTQSCSRSRGCRRAAAASAWRARSWPSATSSSRWSPAPSSRRARLPTGSARWRRRALPGPPAAWALLDDLLPAAGASAAPTLVDLLADPFFSVAAAAAPPAAPLDLHGSAAEFAPRGGCTATRSCARRPVRPRRPPRRRPAVRRLQRRSRSGQADQAESARRKSKQAAAAADDAAPSPPPEPALAEASLDAQLAAASLAEEPEDAEAKGADASAARQSSSTMSEVCVIKMQKRGSLLHGTATDNARSLSLHSGDGTETCRRRAARLEVREAVDHWWPW